MKSLFVPGARVTPVKLTGTTADITELSVEEYIARYGKALEARGYFERSTHRLVEQFGDIAHVLSTYEARNLATDAAPYVRGVSSFQLLKSGDRYWIVSIYWEAEHDGLTIPAKYLPPAQAGTPK